MILVFDTETTGLPLHPSAPLDKQPRIIEFGAALLSQTTGEVVEEFNALISPGNGVPLEDIIVKITGITDEDLINCPRFSGVLPQIQTLFAQAKWVVAHNLPFDRSLMKFDLARIDKGLEVLPWPANELCTVGAFKEIWGRNPKMTELYEWSLGRPLAQTHRAIEDVRALVEIIQKEELWRDMQ